MLKFIKTYFVPGTEFKKEHDEEYADYFEAEQAMEQYFRDSDNATYLELAKYGNGKVGITIKDKHRKLMVKLKSKLPVK